MSGSYREMNEQFSAAENDRSADRPPPATGPVCLCGRPKSDHGAEGAGTADGGCQAWVEDDGTRRDRSDEIRVAVMRQQARRTAWPYTTPSGHVYVEPDTYRGVRDRTNDYAQAIIETWDQAERPPTVVTWKMLGLVETECDNRQKALVSMALDVLTMAHVGGMPDSYWQTDGRIARACRYIQGVSPATARQWVADNIDDILTRENL